ncbi:hypothetical protein BH20VER3_BH20VER3_00540 [soil metagenome]
MIVDQHGRTLLSTGNRPRSNSLGEAFEGARFGGYRGYWFLPTLDTAKQMPAMTRDQIAKKNVWCYNNIGELRAIIDGLAIDEVDTAIWPKARTSSPAFNRAVTDRFDEENKDPRSFDLRQIESCYSGQFLVRRTLRLLGDIFGQLIRPLTPGAPPRMGFLPGYQCTSQDVKDQPLLRDGIRLDARTRAADKYRFAIPKSGESETQNYVELPADDVLHFHDPFLADQIRGISTLAPVTRQMFSMDDIDKAETTGQLLRSRVAYAVENVGPDEVSLPRLPGVVDMEVVENPDGSKTVIQKVIQRDGTEVDVITPPSGMKIRTLESNRGGAIDFRNFLARGLMHATVYPPEWILFLAGLSQGTVARVVQNRVQKIANFFRAVQVDTQYMQRWYRYWLWQRIKAGAFDGAPGGLPPDWFLHKLVYPADMSVDLGRDGRLYDDRVGRGNMSPSDYHALSGRDDEDVDEEIVDAAIRRRQLLQRKLEEHPEVELRYEEVWLPPSGSPIPPPQPDEPTPPPDPASTNGPGK